MAQFKLSSVMDFQALQGADMDRMASIDEDT
jgi:hypothetical protein